ncbi:MAG: iron chelate uptake ABC transporter family permease subunit [Ilumatobacteraceae bacterium]
MLCLSLILGISWGTVTLPIGEVWGRGRLAPRLSDTTPTPVQDQIIWQFRTPRVLLAAVVGGALSLAGACLQVLARNPLADPYVLGVSSGAAFGAVLAPIAGWTAIADLARGAAPVSAGSHLAARVRTGAASWAGGTHTPGAGGRGDQLPRHCRHQLPPALHQPTSSCAGSCSGSSGRSPTPDGTTSASPPW